MEQEQPKKVTAPKRRYPDAAEDHYDDGERAIEKIDGAWAKAALYFRTGRHFGHPARSVRARSLIRIYEEIEVFRRRFEGGNTLALLQAIATCAEENLPLPTWLALAYQSALSGFLRAGGPLKLDEVFYSPSLPTDTPKKAASARQDWSLGGVLWVAAWEAAKSDETLVSLDAVIDVVLEGGRYGVGKTKARKLILMLDENQFEFLRWAEYQRLSQFLKKRRNP